MPLEAPLGYGRTNELGTSEPGPMMLDDFVREDGTKIYCFAVAAKNANFEGAHFKIQFRLGPIWGLFLKSGRRGHRLAKIIVFRTPEKPITNRWGERSSLIFDPEDPITLELLDSERDAVDEKVKSAREVEFQRALEEIKKCYDGPDDKLPIIEHKILKVHSIDPWGTVVRTV
jgi:hypothetical protein